MGLSPNSVAAQFTNAEKTFLASLADHSYTDGQLIIGNSATGGVSFATLTAGANITITNGNGTISIASSGGATGITIGTTTITSGTNTRILYDNSGVVGEYTISGTGTVVAMATSPSFTTPALGVATATSLAIGGATIGTNGLAITGHVLVEGVTSTGATGTGKFVFDGTPTLVTPVLGVATATSINKVAITAPASSATLVIADGKTLTASVTMTLQGGDASILSIAASKTVTFSNTLTFTGTDGTSFAFPSTSDTVDVLGVAQTFTAVKTFTPAARSSGVASYFIVNIPADTAQTASTESIGFKTVTATRTWATTGTVALQRENYFAGVTYASAGASQTFTDITTVYIDRPLVGSNAVFTRAHSLTIVDSTSAASSITGGFVISTTLGTTATSVGIGGGNINAGGTLVVGGHVTLEGVTSTGATGTGKLVFDGTPTLVTPVLGAATATSINGLTITSTAGTLTIANNASAVLVTSGNFTLTLTSTATTNSTFPSGTDTLGGLATAQTWTALNTFKQINWTNNAITASGNAATVPITHRLQTVTNNSAATLTITMTTTSAVDGQLVIVRILDSSAAAQTITWVNTENSTATAPTTSNGSTTLFLTVGFIYNSGTSKWRCIASA